MLLCRLSKIAQEIVDKVEIPNWSPFTGTRNLERRGLMIFTYRMIEKFLKEALPSDIEPDRIHGKNARVTPGVSPVTDGGPE